MSNEGYELEGIRMEMWERELGWEKELGWKVIMGKDS